MEFCVVRELESYIYAYVPFIWYLLNTETGFLTMKYVPN